MSTPALSKEAYDAKWIARVRGNCIRSESGCLLWQGGLHPKGYGQTGYRTTTVRTHRKMYELVNGVKLTPDVLVCHRCDVRHCVEPTHLWIGSNDDNQLDAWKKGRKRNQSAPACDRGHLFTPENTRRYSPNYRRTCLTCQRIRMRIEAGWTRAQAESMPVTLPGHRPVNANFKQARKQRSVG